MDEPLVWLGAVVLLLLGFYFIERSGLLGNMAAPCSCGGGGSDAGGDVTEKGPPAAAPATCAEGFV